MVYTGHGHHIPGTIRPDFQPKDVARCGGVQMCPRCKKEAQTAMANGIPMTPLVDGEIRAKATTYGIDNPGTAMVPEDMQLKAKRILREHIDSHYGASTEKPAYGVYIVDFYYTLGHWKCHLATDMRDGKLYELTYNSSRKETYLDEYRKTVNVCIPDKEIGHEQVEPPSAAGF